MTNSEPVSPLLSLSLTFTHIHTHSLSYTVSSLKTKTVSLSQKRTNQILRFGTQLILEMVWFMLGTYGETFIALWKEPSKTYKVTIKKLYDTNISTTAIEYLQNETKSLL
jgi:hypothetical protein